MAKYRACVEFEFDSDDIEAVRLVKRYLSYWVDDPVRGARDVVNGNSDFYGPNYPIKAPRVTVHEVL